MCPINEELPRRPKGRPVEGLEARSVERKIRIEPYLDQQLGSVCRHLRISKSEAIRQAIMLWLKEVYRQYI